MKLFRHLRPPPAPKAPDLPELTNEVYARWLRAYRPAPLSWFLSLSVLEQEQLALIGDDHRKDTCLAIGWAVRNPAAAEAGVAAAAGDPEGEVELVRQLAGRVLQDIARAAQAPSRSTIEPPRPAAPPEPKMGPTGRQATP